MEEFPDGGWGVGGEGGLGGGADKVSSPLAGARFDFHMILRNY